MAPAHCQQGPPTFRQPLQHRCRNHNVEGTGARQVMNVGHDEPRVRDVPVPVAAVLNQSGVAVHTDGEASRFDLLRGAPPDGPGTASCIQRRLSRLQYRGQSPVSSLQ